MTPEKGQFHDLPGEGFRQESQQRDLGLPGSWFQVWSRKGFTCSMNPAASVNCDNFAQPYLENLPYKHLIYQEDESLSDVWCSWVSVLILCSALDEL